MATIPNGRQAPAGCSSRSRLYGDAAGDQSGCQAMTCFASTQDVFGGCLRKPPATRWQSRATSGPGKCETPAALRPPLRRCSRIALRRHSSISGNVTNADQNTAVVLADSGVQVQNAAVAGVNTYSFCAPTDRRRATRSSISERQPDGSCYGARRSASGSSFPHQWQPPRHVRAFATLVRPTRVSYAPAPWRPVSVMAGSSE